jgi:hypothetical protein
MLTQLGRPTSASGSAIAAGHHCEATSWQRKVPAMIGNGVRKSAVGKARVRRSRKQTLELGAGSKRVRTCHRIRCPAGTAQQGRLSPLDRAECAGGGDVAACKFAGPDRGASGQRELPSAGSLQADRKEREIAEPAVDPGFCCVRYLIYDFGSLR